jgi:hypothetical protein
MNIDKFISELHIVIEKMEQYGGSFEKALAKTLMYADLANANKIKQAFPELWEKWLNF